MVYFYRDVMSIFSELLYMLLIKLCCISLSLYIKCSKYTTNDKYHVFWVLVNVVTLVVKT